MKLIRSLAHKKFRKEHGLFLIEGDKITRDVLDSAPAKIHSLYATKEWLNTCREQAAGRYETVVVTADEMRRISRQKAPQPVLALLHRSEPVLQQDGLLESFSLVLDTIQDPGNLGTIIRIADWFGIRHIICSPETADLYNPKTIQSSMGSFLRVQVHYLQLGKFLGAFREGPGASAGFTIYGSVIEGENLFESGIRAPGVLMLGNESKGISPGLAPFIDRRLMIPSYQSGPGPDSLNVATAAAIFCAALRRDAPRG